MSDAANSAGRTGSAVSRRAFIGGSAALAGTTWLGGCSSGEPTAGSAGGAASSAERLQLTFLTILPPQSLTFAPELLADAGGHFSNHGLDVTFELTRGSAQAIQLVLAGRAPLTRISQIEGMRAAANRGAPLVNVGMVFKDSTIRYVSSVADPLREPSDFVGKMIGIPSEGGSSELELDLFLAAAGVDRESVRRQVVGLTPGVFNLVEQGRIAGYAVSIDTAKILEVQQENAVVLNPGEFIESGGQFYMASRSGLEQNREAIRRFVAAVHDSLAFMLADETFDETLEILRSKYSFDGLNDTGIAKESLREYTSVWTAAGEENLLLTLPQRWTNGYMELVAAGLVETGASPDAWFTNELVDPL
jgi:NitT/TauT family transport system substrate-binding protein